MLSWLSERAEVQSNRPKPFEVTIDAFSSFKLRGVENSISLVALSGGAQIVRRLGECDARLGG